MPRRVPPPRRAAAPALLALAALALGACASATRALARPYVLAPTGLEVGEQAMRDALAAGRWDDAARRAGAGKAGGPSDALLRALYAGTAGFYAGRYAESAASFDRAARLADERYTKRVSRGALALVTNDRALPYVPGDNERLMAGYYATLAYLHAGDAEGAAVEARRLALALQAADDRRDPADRSLRAALRYLTGAVFEATGDREDAEVAYRNAAALGARADTALARRAAADSALRGARRGAAARRAAERARAAVPAAATGEVLVLVEGGFVAHRVDERLSVRLDDDAAEALTTSRGGVVVAGAGDDARAAWSPAPGTLGARLAALLTGDAGVWAGELPAGLALADSGAAPAQAAPGGAPAAAALPVAGPSVVGVPARTARQAERGGLATARPAPPAAARAGGWGVVLGDDDRRGRAARSWHGGRVFTVAWPAYRRPLWAPRLGGVLAALPGAPAAPAATAATTAGSPTTGGASPTAAAGLVARGDLSAAAAGDFRRDRGKLLARLVARSAVRAMLAERAGRTHRELGDVVRALSNVVEHADTRSWHLLPGEVQVVRLRLPAGAQPLAVDVGGRPVPFGTVQVAAGALRFVSVRLWDAAGERVTAAGVAPAGGAATAAGAAAARADAGWMTAP